MYFKAYKLCSAANPCNYTLQPNIPDHSSQQQLRLSHSVLVSAAPGHFVWSHQWNQICTAERQPLVGSREGRGLQQWPEALSLRFLFTLCPHSLLVGILLMYCNHSSWLAVGQLCLLLFSPLLIIQNPCNLITVILDHDSIWNLIGRNCVAWLHLKSDWWNYVV